MLYFATLAGVGIAVFRLALRISLRRLRAKGRNLRYVLAIGGGPTLETLVRRFDSFPELGLRVIGVVTSESSALERVAEKPVLGKLHQLREILARVRADEVLICPMPGRQDDVYTVLELLQDETVDIRLVPDVLPYVTLGCDVEDFDGMPVVHLNNSPLVGSAAWAKRAIDLVLALLALIVFAPLMALIAILIKATSRGPVLYAQERMGLDGRTFQMLKFRSMRVDAEKGRGAQWATASDDRRTSIGAILRRTSLDELPQFWNVLRGDMSLVGPRPERPVFVNQFRTRIPHYMLRHKVKSGITGWAQVNGWRGNTCLARRIECDLFYIRNWSLALDLKILTMTLWKGFIHKNAY
jgi:Undecaprenyl-phosphate glucose phosphotransferase